jgi:hypothetical protein
MGLEMQLSAWAVESRLDRATMERPSPEGCHSQRNKSQEREDYGTRDPSLRSKHDCGDQKCDCAYGLDDEVADDGSVGPLVHRDHGGTVPTVIVTVTRERVRPSGIIYASQATA